MEAQRCSGGCCPRTGSAARSTSPYPAPTAGVAAPASPSTAPSSRPATSPTGPTSRSRPPAAACSTPAARSSPSSSARPCARPSTGATLDPRLRVDRTRSDLEKDFRAFVRRQRLPPAEINVPVGGYTVDFLWRGRHLVVETDSYEYHHGDVAFEDDHARDLALRRLGFTVFRYTGRQLEREAGLVAAEIRSYLCRP